AAPQPSDGGFRALDFVLARSVSLLEGWTPQLVKLSLNYLALMCPTHFSLLQIDFDYDAEEDDDCSCHHHHHHHHHGRLYAKNGQFNHQQQTTPHLIYNRLFDEPPPPESAAYLLGTFPGQSQFARSNGGV